MDKVEIRGRDIYRYHHMFNGDKVWYRPDLMKIKQAAAPKEARFFEVPQKLLIRRVSGSKLIASLDNQQLFLLQDNMFICDKIPQYNEAFVLCLLNSKLLNSYLDYVSTVFSVSQGDLQPLPIRRIAFTTPAAERTSLVDVAKTQYQQSLTTPSASGDWRTWRERWRSLWDWADARLPQLADGSPDTANEQSDAVHDLLAHLAERMIALHKQKQADAATFTGWLEAETGSAIDGWPLKTVVQSFWEQPWDEIERALQRNRGRFAQTQGLKGKQADAALLPLLRAARGRWQAAKDALAPTLAAITATDRLIDLLVYRLYGLADDEIELVEGG